ncbi:Uncharacterized protein HZ326_2089 [Fusarium oxysporum f. sp. albedinis]|nr:Uncharacterized protein HZ326_2089 [Fusarium oxysporum f. sp. albedinis]
MKTVSGDRGGQTSSLAWSRADISPGFTPLILQASLDRTKDAGVVAPLCHFCAYLEVETELSEPRLEK